MKMNLGIIFGGRSGEHEVSLQSARSIANEVNRERFKLLLLAVDKQGNWYLADEDNYLINPDDPANIRLNVRKEQQIAVIPDNNSNKIIQLSSGKNLGSLDVVFPIIHGTFGEDGGLQGFFSILNLPYIGADITGSAVAMDKLIAKQLLMKSGIAVADYLVATNRTDLKKFTIAVIEKFELPVFVKPACSGSSVGVFKAASEMELEKSIAEALKFDDLILIEEAIDGREIECAVLGNDELFASVPGEIIPNHSFYSYEAKYIDAEGASLEMPAKIPDNVTAQVKEFAIKSYRALFCKGMARVDMFLTDGGKLILNEINTLPGFTKISMYPKLMELSGISFSELIDRLVDLAIELHNQRELQLKHILSVSAY
jgi:D-alanine-D-alanine ligase